MTKKKPTRSASTGPCLSVDELASGMPNCGPQRPNVEPILPEAPCFQRGEGYGVATGRREGRIFRSGERADRYHTKPLTLLTTQACGFQWLLYRARREGLRSALSLERPVGPVLKSPFIKGGNNYVTRRTAQIRVICVRPHFPARLSACHRL